MYVGPKTMHFNLYSIETHGAQGFHRHRCLVALTKAKRIVTELNIPALQGELPGSTDAKSPQQPAFTLRHGDSKGPEIRQTQVILLSVQ